MNIDDARRALADFVKDSVGTITTAKVRSVDQDKLTVDVTLTSTDMPVLGVKLSATEAVKGIVPIPSVDSYVTIQFLDGTNQAVVVGYSQIQSLFIDTVQNTVFNGGGFGGLIKINELITELTKVTTYLQALQSALNGFVPTGTAADGGALAALLKTAVGSLQMPNYSGIENQKVKH